MAQGYKQCPDCNKSNTLRTKNCECGFDFMALKQQREEEKEAKKEARLKKREEKEGKKTNGRDYGYIPPYIPPKELTKKDHAKRILSYGKERSSVLLKQSKLVKCWNHVDWDLVEKGL